MVQSIDPFGTAYLKKRDYEVILASDTKKSALLPLMRDCDGVISKTQFLDRELLCASQRLKVIGKHGAGVDNVVNIKDASQLGIYVVNTPCANSVSVAEHTLAMILALSKNLIIMDTAVRNGDFFITDRLFASEVRGKVLSIIGFGNIGRRAAAMAHFGFGMKISAFDPYYSRKSIPEYVHFTKTLEEAVSSGDFVSLHLPATGESFHIINERTLNLMKPGSCLINCARGSVVDTQALAAALAEKKIRGAALDVFEEEPLPTDSPLLKVENVILTPHSCALSAEALRRMSGDVAMGVDQALSGNVPNWCVNWDAASNAVKRKLSP